mmetsp:Transcript_87803/g.253203  ORF Transcript_87803/g.253203 Transcript_87803/m.253203 type:complete len:337 (-) Transcript_87803:57-1067(-)
MASKPSARTTFKVKMPFGGGRTVLKISASLSSTMPHRFGTTISDPICRSMTPITLSLMVFSSSTEVSAYWPWNSISILGWFTKNSRMPWKNGGRGIMPTHSRTKSPETFTRLMPMGKEPNRVMMDTLPSHWSFPFRTKLSSFPARLTCSVRCVCISVNCAGLLPKLHSFRSKPNLLPKLPNADLIAGSMTRPSTSVANWEMHGQACSTITLTNAGVCSDLSLSDAADENWTLLLLGLMGMYRWRNTSRVGLPSLKSGGKLRVLLGVGTSATDVAELNLLAQVDRLKWFRCHWLSTSTSSATSSPEPASCPHLLDGQALKQPAPMARVRGRLPSTRA